MEIEAGDQYFHVVWSDQVDSSRIRSYEPNSLPKSAFGATKFRALNSVDTVPIESERASEKAIVSFRS